MRLAAIALLASLSTVLEKCKSEVEVTFNIPTESDFVEPQHYAADGTLTLNEVAVMEHLAWPQTYGDMKGTFGLPAYRSYRSDIYHVEGSDQQIEVFYDGKQATGYVVK